MTTPQRLTKLEAVNILLDTIGETPVNSLTGTLTADVAKAKSTLEEVNKRVQNKGWHFNTKYDYTLTPDAITNHIAIPVNVVKVDADRTVPSIALSTAASAVMKTGSFFKVWRAGDNGTNSISAWS